MLAVSILSAGHLSTSEFNHNDVSDRGVSLHWTLKFFVYLLEELNRAAISSVLCSRSSLVFIMTEPFKSIDTNAKLFPVNKLYFRAYLLEYFL